MAAATHVGSQRWALVGWLDPHMSFSQLDKLVRLHVLSFLTEPFRVTILRLKKVPWIVNHLMSDEFQKTPGFSLGWRHGEWVVATTCAKRQP